MENVVKFYNTLFDPEECTCFSSTPYGVSIIRVSNWYLQSGNFFCINPLKDNRRDSNVTVYRNILCEFDKIPLENQLTFIADSNMPVTSIVYSGGKSMHVIISLETPCEDKESYKRLVKRIHKKLGGASIVDTSTSNPSRFSRTPEVKRGVINQELIFLDIRISNDVLFNWLGPEELDIAPPVTTPTTELSNYTHYFLNFGAEPGTWNRQLFISVCDMSRNNYSKEQIIAECQNITGHLDDKDLRTINSAWSTIHND